MNKYQEALNEMYAVLNDSDRWHEKKSLLQELVDKETPMKPIKIIRNRHEWSEDIVNLYEAIACGKCFYALQEERINNFCPQCGQKLDWSDEDVED